MAPVDLSQLTEDELSKYDWITLRKDMDEVLPMESASQKFMRKFSENPLVPIGCLATTGALGYGLWTFRQGRREMSQMMMRARIVAQGLTVFALIVGVAIGAQKTVKNKQ